MTKYQTVDLPLTKWKEAIIQQYPTAKFYVAPEEEGGTRTAVADGEVVGDWDGSADPCGRIVVAV